ncbi:hypothetical protein KEH51_09765 [[Brevibacterium] frigoritolerans]|uniref:Lipoprotein n=1 Tax=Peribacillus frigoritolerans TaxID=450367 RepID=A0A941JAD5_9BACI|nr:hypothetical protein [Peribacillus frigoritolerans]
MNGNSFLHSYLNVFLLTALCLITLSGCQAASDNVINQSKQEDSLSNEDTVPVRILQMKRKERHSQPRSSKLLTEIQ